MDTMSENLLVKKNHQIRTYEDFTSDLKLHIYIPFDSNLDSDDQKTLELIMKDPGQFDIASWIQTEQGIRLSNFILFQKENSSIPIAEIIRELKLLKKVSLTHGRLLVEVDRSLHRLSSNIGRGGSALESLLANYCIENNLSYSTNHLFRECSKNIDFYIPELKLAIECKYSQSSGTKHGGALKDIDEQAKAKRLHGFRLGVMVAGNQYIEDKEFAASIFSLSSENILDFVFTPADLVKSPVELLKVNRSTFSEEDLKIVIKSEPTWTEDLSDIEKGIDDACRWLHRFLNVKHLNFQSLLVMWIKNTPFAIEVLRLTLGWSESKMTAFLNASFNRKGKLKASDYGFRDIDLIVKKLDYYLSDYEKELITNYFKKPVTHLDLLKARESALRGSAVKKLDTSKIFVEACIAGSAFEVSRDVDTVVLPSRATVKPSFKVSIEGKSMNVLCKYYASSGSTISDTVKTINGLIDSNRVNDWYFIMDGAGWLERKKDLERMLSLARDNNLHLYTYSAWVKLCQRF